MPGSGPQRSCHDSRWPVEANASISASRATTVGVLTVTFPRARAFAGRSPVPTCLPVARVTSPSTCSTMASALCVPTVRGTRVLNNDCLGLTEPEESRLAAGTTCRTDPVATTLNAPGNPLQPYSLTSSRRAATLRSSNGTSRGTYVKENAPPFGTNTLWETLRSKSRRTVSVTSHILAIRDGRVFVSHDPSMLSLELRYRRGQWPWIIYVRSASGGCHVAHSRTIVNEDLVRPRRVAVLHDDTRLPISRSGHQRLTDALR